MIVNSIGDNLTPDVPLQKPRKKRRERKKLIDQHKATFIVEGTCKFTIL